MNKSKVVLPSIFFAGNTIQYYKHIKRIPSTCNNAQGKAMQKGR
jgi:hypothetical protein